MTTACCAFAVAYPAGAAPELARRIAAPERFYAPLGLGAATVERPRLHARLAGWLADLRRAVRPAARALTAAAPVALAAALTELRG